MDCKKMSNSQDRSFPKNKESISSSSVLSPVLYWILFFASILTILLGFFSITGVIINTLQTDQLNFFDGLLVGFLLVMGGFVLLLGTIIMKNWSPPPFSEMESDSL